MSTTCQTCRAAMSPTLKDVSMKKGTRSSVVTRHVADITSFENLGVLSQMESELQHISRTDVISGLNTCCAS